ncbi:hypothetical protein M8J77_020358 [Diaphorina citri]|nr:hypothetical protein M8J77_020358 [Diaphorina citri]
MSPRIFDSDWLPPQLGVERMMIKECFEILLDILKDALSKKNTNYRESISAQQRLAVCLRYLATGDSMVTISFSYRLGKSTVGKIIHECCEAIIQKLFSQMMPPPGPEDWKKIGKKFEDMWNFPNCLGALDGKHVVIQAPCNSGSLYFNYKHTFSIVLLALVDADYNFIAVDIGAYGRNSDKGIFMDDSELGKALENGNMNIPTHQELPGTNIEAPHVIVGDAAFPLKPYFLRPYPGDHLTREKRIFNYRISRARRVVENAFGILSQKFRIYQRRIHAKPENVDRIVLATCILHNFIKKKT